MPVFPIATLTFILALMVTLAVTPLVIRLSWSLRLIDRPDERKSHAAPVPRLGGVAVLAGFGAGLGLSLWLSGYSGTLFGAVRYHWIGWIGAILALFTCGVIDDVIGLRARSKLLVQIAAGIGVFAAGFRIDFMQLPGDVVHDLGVLSLPLTLLWVVAITNAINLIDGLDGLATGMGFLITATIAGISFYQGVFPVAVISLALAGSLLGFLPYNFTPARIFLGDSGSQFLGLTLAVISMRGLQKSATAVAVLAPIVVLGLPILDTFLVVLRRAWRIQASSSGVGLRLRLVRSKGLFEPDREHIHHNLLDLGLTQRRAVLVLYSAVGVFCIAAYALVALRDPRLALLLAGSVAVATSIVKLLAVRRRSAPPGQGPSAIGRGAPAQAAPSAPPGKGARQDRRDAERLHGSGRC